MSLSTLWPLGLLYLCSHIQFKLGHSSKVCFGKLVLFTVPSLLLVKVLLKVIKHHHHSSLEILSFSFHSSNKLHLHFPSSFSSSFWHCLCNIFDLFIVCNIFVFFTIFLSHFLFIFFHFFLLLAGLFCKILQHG